MTLRNQIQEDIKAAMRNKDNARLGTLRLLFAQIKQTEIDNRVKAGGNVELNDEEIFGVIGKMIKQRMESIEQFKLGNRDDLVASETAEVEVLKFYLPKQLSPEEIDDLIKLAIKEVAATSIKDMSKVVAFIKPKAQGRADMSAVSAKIKEILSK
jgi:uncharacterized protein